MPSVMAAYLIPNTITTFITIPTTIKTFIIIKTTTPTCNCPYNALLFITTYLLFITLFFTYIL